MPCAGPVLAAITVVAASSDVGWRAVVLTLSYAVGAAIPMLLIALGGRGAALRLRAHAQTVRIVSGVVIALVALGIAFHVDDRAATLLPGYTEWAQKHVESSSTAKRELGKVSGVKALEAKPQAAAAAADALRNYGPAPELARTGDWFNTQPLTLHKLRGKVVLIDFWTYSCINCLRTLPHLKSWYATYHPNGFEILGVHTPEFAFEHVSSNVRAAVKRLGIKYPVVQDNDFGTWNAYHNQYWPAEYLIDRNGNIRHVGFGEGDYDETESLIRRLVGANGAMAEDVPDLTPEGVTTPESYLGFERLARYAGSPLQEGMVASYRFPAHLTQDALAYAGQWRVEAERIVAGLGAKLRLNYYARNVYLVLGGRGKVEVLVDGKPTATVNVTSHRLYTLLSGAHARQGLLELRFDPGVEAYAFTFG